MREIVEGLPLGSEPTVLRRGREVAVRILHVGDELALAVDACPADWTLGCWDAVYLDATHSELVPDELDTFELPKRIRYRHNGTVCSGTLVEVTPGQSDSSIDGAVVATTIDGTETAEGETHHIPLSAITENLEACDR